MTLRTLLRLPGRLAIATLVLLPAPLTGQGPPDSPWADAVEVISDAFTGDIAQGLSLVAIVIGGLMFAFGEGGAKRTTAGIIFGVGMAMAATQFLTWLTQ